MATALATRSAVRATGLRKSYGDHLVLDGIDLDVAEGSVFALLGPNGAGKTTTVQILTTLIGADAGEVTVAGHDLVRERDAVRGAIGVTGQFSAVDNILTGEENLLLMAGLNHLPRPQRRGRVADLLERFDIVDADLLGRHAPPPRPGHEPDGRPAAHLPRRADHRARPPQPAGHVADPA
jgi:ABC-2 type transport system ATP-binding protein